MIDRIEQILAQLKPVLVMQGRDVIVAEATEQQITLALKGFCGGCGCSEEYVEGLREMVASAFPTTRIDVRVE
jgi:Fe-S cluster biogenesis protein NfuA